MPKVEVEHRGYLDQKKFNELRGFFSAKGKLLKKFDRFSVIYQSKHVKSVSKLKTDIIDLKVRITNKKAELVMKHGKWDAKDSRREFSFYFDADKFGEMIELLKILGQHHVVLMDNHTYLFKYKEIEWALVQVPDWGYYFEAEIANDEDFKNKAAQKIDSVCNELDLKPIEDEKEYHHLLDSLNNRKGYKFDLNKVSFPKVRKRFKEFF